MRVRWPHLSIRATVLIAIVVGMVLPALVVLSVDSRLARLTHEPAVQRNRDAVLVLAAAVVTEPAWTLSEVGLREAVKLILQEPSVCAVELRDLQPTKTPLRIAEQRCARGMRVVARDWPVMHQGQPVATLRLSFDDSEVDRLVRQRQGVMWWLVLAQVVFGVAVLLGVLALRLLRPIDRLKQQASTLAAREPMPALPWRRRDELGELGQHLNTVRDRIQALFAELENKNTQLSKMAMYDHLTGLPNRTLFRELFLHESGAARRHRHSWRIAVHRPGPLQGRERHARPRRRRRVAARRQPAAERDAARRPTSCVGSAATSSWCCSRRPAAWSRCR